jgi:hypothetical protein
MLEADVNQPKQGAQITVATAVSTIAAAAVTVLVTYVGNGQRAA